MTISVDPPRKIAATKLFATRLTLDLPRDSKSGALIVDYEKRLVDGMGETVSTDRQSGVVIIRSSDIGDGFATLAEAMIAAFEKFAPVAIARQADEAAAEEKARGLRNSPDYRASIEEHARQQNWKSSLKGEKLEVTHDPSEIA